MEVDRYGVREWRELARGDGTKSLSRTGEAYARIRDDLINGRLEAGNKLKIEHLSSLYEVSATTVREALSHLASDGLVVHEDRRGFRVAEIVAGEFEELLAIRCTVEERALRLALTLGGSQWEESVVVSRYRLLNAVRTEENEAEWERCHKAFHMSLISGCRSGILLRLCNQLFDENSRYRNVVRHTNSEPRDIQAEHEAIAAAALARDADRAVELLLVHYIRTGKLLSAALKILHAAKETPAGDRAREATS